MRSPAISIVAAVGDFTRFDDPDKLVAYVGLNPRVRQSGNSAPVHGRISKTGRAHVRGVLVEAAWSASRAPGPLRAFYQRVKARRGFQKAIVATARKMPVLGLAPGHQGPGLRVRPTRAGHPQASQARTRRRRTLTARELPPARRGL